MIKRLVVLPLFVGALLVSGCGGGGSEPLSPTPPPGQTAPLAKYTAPGNIQIPAIGVDGRVVPIQMNKDQELVVDNLDTEPMLAGWYEKSAKPGQRGPLVIAAHVNYNGPGLFKRLAEVKPGALVQVGDTADRAWTYKVTRTVTIDKDAFPTQQVYGRTEDEKLVLITCGGRFDSSRRVGASAGSYVQNVIVFATLV